MKTPGAVHRLKTRIAIEIKFSRTATLRPETLNLYAGWLGVLGGIISGAVVGLFFHAEHWMGGYASYRRRLIRLGHISFFGLGFLNLFFGLSATPLGLTGMVLRLASWSWIVAGLSMPACCFLAAWRKPLRHLFPIPVCAALLPVIGVLLGAKIR